MGQLTVMRPVGDEYSASRPRRNPSFPVRRIEDIHVVERKICAFREESHPKGGMVRKFLYITALSIVATFAFQSVVSAQYFTSDSPGDCSGAAEQLQAERPNVPDGTIEQYLKFVPDAGGCIEVDGYSPPAPLGALNAVAYDPSTGAELGLVKDLDPDLTSGANATDYREFCGTFPVPLGGQTAQDYYERDANDKEGAILDPDGDGLACTPDDEAFLSGDVGEPSGEEDPCADTMGYFVYIPTVDGCLLLEGSYPVVGVINSPVYDAETWRELGEEETIGTFKELVDIDDMYEYVDLDLTYEEFCTAFPTPDFAGPAEISGLTAQGYYDQLANTQEQAILDPNADGLACTSDDEEFLSGGGDYESEFQFENTWTGMITQTNPDGEVLEFGIEAEMIPLSDITDAMIGEVIGEVGYPSVGCSGVWVLEGFDGDSLIIEERITEGSENCFETPVTLTPRDDGSLEYYFLDSDGTVGECVLTLQGSGVPEEDPEGGGGELLPSEKMGELGMNELPDTGGPALSPLVGGLLLASGILGVIAIRRRT